MAEPSKQAKYPKQADTRTLNDKIWFQKDPDSMEWYAESNDMQLLQTNGKSTLTKSGPHLDQGEFALWFLFVTKNQPLQMGTLEECYDLFLQFQGIQSSAIRGTVEGAGLFRGQ